jgi:hypothetical protein
MQKNLKVFKMDEYEKWEYFESKRKKKYRAVYKKRAGKK